MPSVKAQLTHILPPRRGESGSDSRLMSCPSLDSYVLAMYSFINKKKAFNQQLSDSARFRARRTCSNNRLELESVPISVSLTHQTLR
jgi:hypothetical protein